MLTSPLAPPWIQVSICIVASAVAYRPQVLPAIGYNRSVVQCQELCNTRQNRFKRPLARQIGAMAPAALAEAFGPKRHYSPRAPDTMAEIRYFGLMLPRHDCLRCGRRSLGLRMS